MNTLAYRLRGVAIGYRPQEPVLRDINLDLEMGSIVALSGANGAGKSTLLNLLALELPVSAGRLEFFGEELANCAGPGSHRRLQVGMLPQAPYLFDRSVLGNITMGLRFHGVGRRVAESRARAMLDELGLGFLVHRSIRELSGGECQKLAIVRLLLLEPRVLLLDEPFSALDSTARHDLETLLQRACRLCHHLLVFSSHDLLQARLFADRVLRVADGTILPADEVNLYQGEADIAAGVFDTGRIRICILPGIMPGEHAYVDPDVVVLSATRPDTSMNNTFRGRVSALGLVPGKGGMIVVVDCGETVRAHVTKATVQTLDIKVGELIWVGFKAASVRVL